MKAKKSERTLNTILDVADKLFKEKGFSKTSFNDLSKEVDISRTTIYDYVKTKEEIVLALLKRNHSKKFFDQYYGNSLEKILNGLIENLILDLKKNYHLNLYIFQSGHTITKDYTEILKDYNKKVYLKFKEELNPFMIEYLDIKINLLLAVIGKEFGDYYLTRNETKLKNIDIYCRYIFDLN